MAADPRITNAVASTLCDALVDQLDSGTIKIYDGTIPATADTALGAQVLLATLTFNATAFGAAANGVATANAITADASADNTGTATWARIATSGATTIMDVTVGTSGEDINLNSVSIQAGANVAITAMTVTMPKT
ncbi:MAG: hypothetical protein FJZ00_00190 [Candidatus Sericytochromatia bacterium]|uniref:Uncharacterized protein n=1 Tax=Candidatus Tanganyikabacteria bacterium TaxID=2961651 RepID=A0A937X3H4_9BACT|nr:hypothetical protein [Candidatus Tanganyikabacteria bacterium]